MKIIQNGKMTRIQKSFEEYLKDNDSIKKTERMDIPKELMKYAKDGKLDNIAYMWIANTNEKIEDKEKDTSFFKISLFS